jgi:hypothetical protein
VTRALRPRAGTLDLVSDEDDLLEAYERELADVDLDPIEPVPRRHARGFWMVAGTIALGSVVLLVEIFANRPLVNGISRVEHDLTVARRSAERVYAQGGTFEPADASALAAGDPGRTYVGADQPASSPGTVSVLASADTWAAASPSQQGTCFYLKLTVGHDPTYLVADGACTGREALRADQPQW